MVIEGLTWARVEKKKVERQTLLENRCGTPFPWTPKGSERGERVRKCSHQNKTDLWPEKKKLDGTRDNEL